MLAETERGESGQDESGTRESREDLDMTFVVEVAGKKCRVPLECTHRKGRLNHDYFRGKCVVCPLHYSAFELHTGKCLNGPAKEDLLIASDDD